MTQPFDGIYKDKKVLITGHTGFKGSWLSLWLSRLGANVHGYSQPPVTDPSLFEHLKLAGSLHHEVADVCDIDRIRKSLKVIQPDIIFNLAAQSLVRESYDHPLETVMVNTMGTVNVLEAVRLEKLSPAIVLITTDKCYDNREWLYGYKETDALGGYDPYSASKGAAEVLIASWRNSFFNPRHLGEHGVRVASARAGNVIGGGDWSKDRIVPDCIRDLQKTGIIQVRNPYATRPWQHVLEPLGGYLKLGAKLLDVDDSALHEYCEAFNFGPLISSNKNVGALVDKIIQVWGSGTWKSLLLEKAGHEASLLHLSIDKAYHKLKWLPQWNFEETVSYTVDWYKALAEDPSGIIDFTAGQIQAYEERLMNANV